MDILVQKLKGISLNVLSKSPNQDELSLSTIRQTEAQFQPSTIQDAHIHKLEYEPSGLKTYYQRPTPQDLLFEEDFF